MYLPTYPPTYLPTYLPTHPPTYLPTYPTTHLPTYLPTHLHTYPPTHLLTYLAIFIYPSMYLATYLLNHYWVILNVNPSWICIFQKPDMPFVALVEIHPGRSIHCWPGNYHVDTVHLCIHWDAIKSQKVLTSSVESGSNSFIWGAFVWRHGFQYVCTGSKLRGKLPGPMFRGRDNCGKIISSSL